MESIDRSLLKVLQKKASGTVAIFERNEFCSCYEDDAFLVANEIFLSEVGLRRVQIGLTELTYHNLNSGQYARVVRDVLLMLHYRLEVYTACDGEWTLKAKGWLGCLGDFEDVVGDSVELSELSTVMALSSTVEHGSDENRLSIAFCNLQDMRMTIAEFSDTDHFSNLEGWLGCLGDFEDVVGDSVELSELSTVMALSSTVEHGSDENRLSIAFCNLQDMRMTIAEFSDTDHFSNLEKCIVSMVPRECIILPSASKSFEDASREEKRMNNLETALKRADITFSEFKNLNAINTEIVDGLLSAKCKGMHISEQQLKCLAALAQHLRITDDVTLYEGRFQLVDYKSAGFMYLDMAAVRALELFSLSYDEDAVVVQSGTLFQLINKCRTPKGQCLLRDWMRRPLFDLRRINERLDVVEALCEMSSCRDKLFEDLLRRVPDVASLSRKLLQKKASLQHCYRLYQLVCLLKRFEEVFSEIHASSDSFAPSVNELCLEPVRLAVLQFDKFAALIESTVDVEYFEETGTYRIRPSIDDKLLETSERMKDIEKQCQKELAKLSKIHAVLMVYELYVVHICNYFMFSARIGSCDYQCKGVSTFMAEMIDSASILEAATSNSLVIIDELGRGTSTYDGFGLAWAIADDILSRIQCFCVFATHFHEMSALHERYPTALRNIRVETKIDENGELVLLYKVLPGIAERSFGINIARLVGLPDNVITTARDMLDRLEKGANESDEENKLIEYFKTLQGEKLREAILAVDL
ncbi:DNA mismatch repair protein Msh2 [Toxocara canis]|uniref:DNA mismatch repair protein Msh2 n=1 Tax=Toxocara canis TaxID=6265 RepID=A0A0B2VIL7_TOXCA|nr:DNA mismatch repair protein Msh2 [Toxocara canis]